jgi:hypothetical protein
LAAAFLEWMLDADARSCAKLELERRAKTSRPVMVGNKVGLTYSRDEG